ncbi:PH domain-containing protein [Kocuria sp.]|uniref:PH domain-containing protein n=1 Tax=Kocuria sp. TaxID=1871328 RepID=UPI0026E0E3FB|nr:PH domain-containing protein [Kocuria sp.]MDO5619161.1 PH domain-containing protein [Kocuria sp.]
MSEDVVSGESPVCDNPDQLGRESGPSGFADVDREHEDILETFRWHWVLYNMFSFWTVVMTAGVLWIGYGILSTFGLDLFGMAVDVISKSGRHPLVLTVAGLAVAMVLGSLFLAISFILENGNFRLARVQDGGPPHLRTQRGLLSTREVNRDETRMRGISIDEPLMFRWMGMADTHVLTTGLSLDSFTEATALVPRGPISVARRVAREVVGDAIDASLRLARHPRAALLRRLNWATLIVIGVIASLLVPVISGVLPLWTIWAAVALWPVTLIGAVIAYRALGYRVYGDYVIARSGLASRSTAVLRRDSISTVAVRQSLLQRWLGLSTVSFMTAAGWGEYDVEDIDAAEAFTLADEAAPGVMTPFLERSNAART